MDSLPQDLLGITLDPADSAYDMASCRKQIITVGTIYRINLSAILVFGVGLGWL